jgi:hypothetical protein
VSAKEIGDQAQTVFPIFCAPNAARRVIAADEIACNNGKSYTSRVAKAQAMFARFCGLNSESIVREADEIASSKGWFGIAHFEKAQDVLPKS